MSAAQAVQTATKAQSSTSSAYVLQRKCACNGSSGLSSECDDCQKKRLLGKPLQTKLRIGEAGDEYEREADRVADQIMHMPDVPVTTKASAQRAPSLVQRRMSGRDTAGAEAAPRIVHDVLSSPGKTLDNTTRAFFEPRFGHDFGHVRVHTDAKAAASARAVDALAYTVGRDIVLGNWVSIGGSRRETHLLAHELAHVVQQTADGCWGGERLLSRTPVSPTPAPAAVSYILDVGHGAFNVVLGKRVIVYDAGTQGNIKELDSVRRVIDRAIDLIPDRHIHELRITHAHQDHVNFIADLLANRFTIDLIEINLFQLEFGRSNLRMLLSALRPDTRLRVLYFDYTSNSLASREIMASALQAAATSESSLRSAVAEAFPGPTQFKLTQQSLDLLWKQMPEVGVNKLVSMKDEVHDARTFIEKVKERIGPEMFDDFRSQILSACIPDVTGAFEAPGYAALVAPTFARQHLKERIKKTTTDLLDTYSTIYVDDSLPDVRVVHGSDQRAPDLTLFSANPAFSESLSADMPSITLWLLSHHMSKGFFPNVGRQEPSATATLKFLDQMIERRLGLTAAGNPGRHIVTASINPNEVSFSIPYLFGASGFEILLAHSGAEVEAMGAGSDPQSQAKIIGQAYVGPMPADTPLLTSYDLLQQLNRIRPTNESAVRLIEQIQSARTEYVKRVLKALHGIAKLHALPEMRNAVAPDEGPAQLLSDGFHRMLEGASKDATRVKNYVQDLRSGSAEESTSDGAKEVAEAAGQSVLDQAARLYDLGLEARNLLKEPVTGGGESGPVPDAAGSPIPLAPPNLPPTSLIVSAPTISALVPRALVRPASAQIQMTLERHGVPNTRYLLPDYRILPEVDFERYERVRVPLSRDLRSTEPQALSKPSAPRLHPEWEWPQRPLSVTAGRPAGQEAVKTPVSSSTPGATASQQTSALVPAQPQMLTSTPNIASRTTPLLEKGLPPGATIEAPRQLTGAAASISSATKRSSLSTEDRVGATAGLAIMIESIGRRWTEYVSERERAKAEARIHAFWPELDRAMREHSDVGAVVFVAMWRHKGGGATVFRFADWSLVPGATIDEAKTFRVDRGGYASPASDEVIGIQYHWIPPLVSADDVLPESWATLDIGEGGFFQKIDELWRWMTED